MSFREAHCRSWEGQLRAPCEHPGRLRLCSWPDSHTHRALPTSRCATPFRLAVSFQQGAVAPGQLGLLETRQRPRCAYLPGRGQRGQGGRTAARCRQRICAGISGRCRGAFEECSLNSFSVLSWQEPGHRATQPASVSCAASSHFAGYEAAGAVLGSQGGAQAR